MLWIEYDGILTLARRVIAQAIEDATCKPRNSHSGPNREEVRDAVLFLTSNRKCFYDSREVWCRIAGYEPQELRDRVIQAIENGLEYRISDFSEARNRVTDNLLPV